MLITLVALLFSSGTLFSRQLIGHQKFCSYHTVIKKECRELMNAINSVGFQQIVKAPMRDNDTPDLSFIAHPDYVNDVDSLFGFSDHALLNVIFSVDVPVSETTGKIIRNFAKADGVGIKADILKTLM